MNKPKREIVVGMSALFVSAILAGCVFWQLTADRRVSYYEMSQSVLDSVKSGSSLYIVKGDIGTGGYEIQTLDISNPLNVKKSPGLYSVYPTGSDLGHLAANGNLIVSVGYVITVFDPARPSGAQLVNKFDLHDMSDSNITYAFYGDYFIRIINDNSSSDSELTINTYRMSDITDNPDPVPVSTLTITGRTLGAGAAALVSGNLLYIASPQSFYVIDISDVNAPTALASCSLPEIARYGNQIVIGGGRAYILPAPSARYLQDQISRVGAKGDAVIVDVSNSSSPKVLSSIEEIGGPCAVSGNYLLARSDKSLDVYDLSNPAEPKLTETLNVRLSASGIHVVGDYALVPEAERFQSKGVATVLIAPYR